MNNLLRLENEKSKMHKHMHSLHTNCIIEGARLYVYDLFMDIQEISRGELSDVRQRTVEHNGLFFVFVFLLGLYLFFFFLSSMHLLPT